MTASFHRPPRAFTLVEILIVIALIGVLAGILLVAVGGATTAAKVARTKSTMESVSAAMDAFALEHGTLPGIVPTHMLHEDDSSGANLTNTQNILLHLLGGARVNILDADDNPVDQVLNAEYVRYRDAAASEDGVTPIEFVLVDPDPDHQPLQYAVVVRMPRVGEGPWINGKQYPPYLSPKDNELLERWGSGYDADPDGENGIAVTDGFTKLPDLIDAWGNPIMIFRKERDTGPLLLGLDTHEGTPQFRLNGIDRYLGSSRLGRTQAQQACDSAKPLLGSRLGADSNDGERDYWLYLLLSHPAMARQSYFDDNDFTTEDPRLGTARSGYAMLSAGPDGIYLARLDGPRNENGEPLPADEFPVTGSGWQENYDRLDPFDDVVMYGGS
ncbi:MAG: type II secretion system protein [Phycisphaerales bacterium]|jgi:prepilin-type N-terminal cleavage/methylation domain-containing protein|nr:type II secretion system protein [Phycisphaerales bacterium]